MGNPINLRDVEDFASALVDLQNQLSQYDEAAKAIAELEKQIANRRKAFFDLYPDANFETERDGFVVSAKTITKRILSSKALKETAPDVWERFATDSVTHTVTVKRPKAEGDAQG